MELNVREEIGLAKIKDSSGERFKKLRKRIDALDGQDVVLDLSTVEMSGYPLELYQIACLPNVTIAAPADVATNFTTYALVTGSDVRSIVRERVIEVKPENPRIQADGEALAAKTVIKDDYYVLPLTDRAVSSVGLTGLIMLRAIEVAAEKAKRDGKGLSVDLTDTAFEGGADLSIAKKLADLRLEKLPVTVVGEEGIAAYVQVCGRVNIHSFSAEQRMRQFKRILPNTVLRLDRYSDKRGARMDIAGRRGCGLVVSSSIILFDGVDAENINFREVDTDCLYTDEDIEYLGLIAPTDTIYKRRMGIAELGISGMFTGSCGTFRRVGAGESHRITGDETLDDVSFIRRGLEYRGINYEKSVYGRVMPTVKK